MSRYAAVTRRLGAAVAGVLLLATLGACSSHTSGDVTYRPAAYGESINGVFRCYYVDDASEVAALIAAGLCPAGSVAYAMPLSWQETYWGYYSSPAYYNTYIPSSRRSHFSSVTVVTFSSKYKSQISSLSSRGEYEGSDGTKVSGASKLKYTGTGTGTGSVHGGGGARGCSLGMTEIQDKTRSGGSHSGGSARTGSSGGGGTSGSKSGSGSGSTTSKTGTSTHTGSNGAC
jgi:hypothetical protein